MSKKSDFEACRMKNAGKNDGDFDPLDVAELLVERVLYNIQVCACAQARTSARLCATRRCNTVDRFVFVSTVIDTS